MPLWQNGILDSKLTKRQMPFRILLPEDYSNPQSRFPVLYLLHGLFGSFENWTDLTCIAENPARQGLIIVMPEGENGWYTDGNNSEDRYESYLISELILKVDEEFRTIPNAKGRAIAGLSMGGYGALKFALKFPRLFEFAASISGAFDAPKWCDELQEEFRESISRIYGDAVSRIRADNDLSLITKNLSDSEIDNLPFLYFDCGVNDSFLAANEKLSGLFARAGVNHEFYALPGGHDWDYWDKRSVFLLDLAFRRLSKPIELTN